MPHKKAQKSLLTMQGFALLGQGVIGVFFLFFIQQNYNLTDWQTVAWFAGTQLAFGLVVWPLNVWGIKRLGVRGMVQMGLLWQTVFYGLLGLGWAGTLSFWLLNISFVLFLACFWPSWHFLSLLATRDGTRGNYLGNFQMLRVGVSLVTPVLTGYLLDAGKGHLVLYVAVSCFFAAMLVTRKLKPTGARMHGWDEGKKILTNTFWARPRRWGFIADAIIGDTMWILWPLYFKAVVGSFTLMGIVSSLTALLEIFTSKIIGHLTDKISATRMLKYGAWARWADVSLRVVYIKFAALPVILGVQWLGAILGPIFQISWDSRMMEIGEEHKGKILDYLVVREIFLGLTRVVWMSWIIVLLMQVETIWLGVVFVVAGLSAFAFRKM